MLETDLPIITLVDIHLLAAALLISPPTVVSVTMPGGRLPVNLATQVGQPYNQSRIGADIRAIWLSAPLEDIWVEKREQVGGVAVVFHATPSPDLRLREIRIEPSSYHLRLAVPDGAPVNRARAHEIAAEARKQLREQGYQDAEVDFSFEPLAGRDVTLRLVVHASDPVRVSEIEFVGNPTLDPKELRASLRALHSRWMSRPAYSSQALDSDLARVLSLYLSKGYLDARVRLDDVSIDRAHARIRVLADAGPRYEAPQVCAGLFAQRREAERKGIVDFSARLEPFTSPTPSVSLGVPYRVGRIEFEGSRHYGDTVIRRNFVLEEGALFDQRLLRKSLAQLNQSDLFEPIDDRNVTVRADEKTGVADITVRLVDRKLGSWSLSGPLWLGGSFQASLSARLPILGAGLVASISLVALTHPALPVLSLMRPYSPSEGWTSGFLIAPQLGWRSLAVRYGATQAQRRIVAFLEGNRGLEPELPVTVQTPAREAVMYCEPRRLSPIRTGAALGLRLLGGLAGL